MAWISFARCGFIAQRGTSDSHSIESPDAYWRTGSTFSGSYGVSRHGFVERDELNGDASSVIIVHRKQSEVRLGEQDVAGMNQHGSPWGESVRGDCDELERKNSNRTHRRTTANVSLTTATTITMIMATTTTTTATSTSMAMVAWRLTLESIKQTILNNIYIYIYKCTSTHCDNGASKHRWQVQYFTIWAGANVWRARIPE